jgi:polar amino acid transport system substrate-binding protein
LPLTTHFLEKNMKPVIFILSLILLLAPSQLFAGQVTERIAENKTLVVGTPGDFPPFTASTSTGRLIGLDIDLAKNLASWLQVKIEFKQMEFSKLISALEENKIDMAMSGMTMTPRRNLQAAFIGPYALSGQSILGKKTILEQVSTPEDLRKVTCCVAVLKGTTGEKMATEMLPDANIISTSTLDESLILLLNGKVDAIVADYPFCRVAEFRYKDRGFAMFDEPLTFEPVAIAVSADDPLFVNLVQNYLAIMTGSGALKKLQEKWFKSIAWMKDLPDLDFFRKLDKTK